jgi:hypothetical protein
MPNCFQLTRISEKEKGPVSLNQIDRELCQLLGEPVDPVNYVLGWFDYHGFMLAMGRDWAYIREAIRERRAEYYKKGNLMCVEVMEDYFRVLDYLEANFTPNAWAEIGGFATDRR